jgi:hypothetical protein
MHAVLHCPAVAAEPMFKQSLILSLQTSSDRILTKELVKQRDIGIHNILQACYSQGGELEQYQY